MAIMSHGSKHTVATGYMTMKSKESALPTFSITSFPCGLKLKIEKRLHAWIRTKNHGTSTTSVSTIGTTERHELFSSK
jgi:hypothetical protein